MSSSPLFLDIYGNVLNYNRELCIDFHFEVITFKFNNYNRKLIFKYLLFPLNLRERLSPINCHKERVARPSKDVKSTTRQTGWTNTGTERQCRGQWDPVPISDDGSSCHHLISSLTPRCYWKSLSGVSHS